MIQRLSRLRHPSLLAIAALLGACEQARDSAVAPASVASTSTAAKSDKAAESFASASAAASAAPEGKASPKAEGKKGGDAGATWKRSEVVANAARLMVGEKEELPLRSVQAKVTVDGFRARVTVDYTYENDRPAAYEGTFQLRLPEEASPYFFAFGESTWEAKTKGEAPPFVQVKATEPQAMMAERTSSWRAPKEARMVPREKAAFAYTETVRQRVDPAIMEWAGAGVFSARVFPLAAHKIHRIVVGYDVDLTKVGGELEYRFDLPEKQVPTAVDVSVAQVPGVNVVPMTAATPGSVSGGRVSFHYENPKEKAIALRLKPEDQSGFRPLVLAGKDGESGYFAADMTFQPPGGASAAHTQGRAVFLVDASLSSNPDKFNVWIKLLHGVLEQNRDSIHEFALATFNVAARWWHPAFVENTTANAADAEAYLGTLALEGATDLGVALHEAAKPVWLDGSKPASWDTFLLSDGAATWGESDPYALSRGFAQKGALFAYRTGMEGTDVSMLSHLTREAGGALFAVTGEGDIAKAAVAHRARPWQLVDVKVQGGSDVLLAGRPKTLFPGQSLRLAGRGAPGANAEIALTVEQGGEKQTVLAHAMTPVASDLAPRVYGQVATGQLEDFDAATESVSRAYATHYRVTGKTCSLLMLESEADYQRFGIVPAKDLSLVQETLVAPLVEQILRAKGESLGDPKARFMNLLTKLGRTPGVSFATTPAYEEAVKGMPNDAFLVAPEILEIKRATREGTPPALLEQLSQQKVAYDDILEDARKRLVELGAGDALLSLSSLVEQSPGDAVLARDVGYSAMALGMKGQAFHLFRRVADARPFEPQTYRAMAQAAVAMGKNDLAIAYYEIGLLGQWDARFGDLKDILRMDYLRFLRSVVKGELATSAPAYARQRFEALSSEVGIKSADLVVMITWNTDNTDVDLHVTEPGGEECFYGHRETRTGGTLTKDVTRGYGPEMYIAKKAVKGEYKVRAHYFASDRNRASARTKVYATVYENWGTPEEKVTEKVVTLESGKEMHDIAVVAR